MRTVHVHIKGRVQGVCFRVWTAEAARSFCLSGWVRNRRDGFVEAVFSGDSNAVSDMLTQCEDGPRDANVMAVTIISEGSSISERAGASVRDGAQDGGGDPAGFRVRPTV